MSILHLTAPIDFWQNSTSFLVRQQSVQQKLTVLEDELKHENDPRKTKRQIPDLYDCVPSYSFF